MTLISTALVAAVVVAAAVTPADAGVPTPPSARSSPAEPTTSTVDEAQLGPGATIAVVTHGDIEQVGASGLARSLEVLTSDGVRHPVYSVEIEESPADWFVGDFLLADWRPEMHTALLRVSLGPDGDMLVSYDVTTGEVREVPAPRRASTVALHPDGSGVLMTTYPAQHRPGRVATLGWDGVKSWLPARADGAAITSVDGRTLVTDVGRSRRWWVTDLSSGTSRRIDTPGSCQPRRWFDADSVIATCFDRRGSQLRRVDLDGTSSRLGIRHTERTRATGPGVFDDHDVRVVQGRSWFESYGGCGGGFLTRQTAAGRVRTVRVPHLRGALSIVGTRGEKLVLTHEDDECDSTPTRAVMALFDPVTKEKSVLTRLGRDEGWREVIDAAEVRSWIG